MSFLERKRAEAEATRFLRKRGYSDDGRPALAVSEKQRSFEQGLVLVPLLPAIVLNRRGTAR